MIRREARIQAEGSNSELEQYKTIVKGMGDLIEHLLSKHQDELSKRVSYTEEFFSLRQRAIGNGTGVIFECSLLGRTCIKRIFRMPS